MKICRNGVSHIKVSNSCLLVGVGQFINLSLRLTDSLVLRLLFQTLAVQGISQKHVFCGALGRQVQIERKRKNATQGTYTGCQSWLRLPCNHS